MIKQLLFVMLIFFNLNNVFATHIVGGNVYYRYLGNYNYEITLEFVRDCGPSSIGFDAYAKIGIFDGNNNIYDSLIIPTNLIFHVDPYLYSPCINVPTTICYERAVYVDTIYLPPTPGGYTLEFQRCCRNASIINIISPLATGATYMAHLTDSAVVPINSNPVFKYWPPAFLCANQPFSFDHSATDADGDSLVYEMNTPYTGLSSAAPGPVAPISPPPYININWQAPYNTANMLGGVPLSIDPQTGLLTCIPNTLGQFVIGMKCKEYRNGILIGETLRDYQFNVVACPASITAAISAPSYVCGTTDVTFNNFSTGAATYTWDFGDTTTAADTSHLYTPTYTYPDTGNFTATLIAYGTNVGCNDTASFSIDFYPGISANYNYTVGNACSNAAFLTDFSVGANVPIVSYNWNFGDGTSSGLQNPSHVYNGFGTYNITLLITDAHGCTNITAIPVTVNGPGPTSIGPNQNVCANETANLQASGGVAYLWTPSAGLSDANISNPLANPAITTQYVVQISVLNNLNDTCIVYDTVKVIVAKSVTADFNYTFNACSNQYDFNNTSFSDTTISSYLWNFGNTITSTNTNAVYTYVNNGTYNVTLTATSIEGCIDTIIEPVTVENRIYSINKDTMLCVYGPVQLYAAGGQWYEWMPSTYLNNANIQNPVSTPDQSVTYQCMMYNILANGDTCSKSLSTKITVSGMAIKNFSNINFSDTIFAGESTTYEIDPCYNYDYLILPDNYYVSNSECNYTFTPPQTTIYSVTVSDSLGCSRILDGVIKIKVNNGDCKEPYLFVPTGFTPNGDGENDLLFVRGAAITELYFAVYNRWGEIVFETTDKNKGWDGTFKGNLMDPAVYAYYVKAKCVNNLEFFKKGNVTLIR